MKIIVCIKQVPAADRVEVDEETGALKRLSATVKTNPYDLFAIETALRIREQAGGSVIALTMGPMQAEAMMLDAYRMGVDEAAVLSDPKFAGADVLATAYTLAQGARLLGGADLIVCGKQTTDGDTAQVGPAMAEHLDIPHISWVKAVLRVDHQSIRVRQELSGTVQISELAFPCLITVDQGICVPRLPSYRLQKETAGRPVRFISFEDLPGANPACCGLAGSPTVVDRIFPPPEALSRVYVEGKSPEEKVDRLYALLAQQKYL